MTSHAGKSHTLRSLVARVRRLARRESLLGFTLLEVMVAVAILGIGLTAILSAQFSAVRATTHAKNISQATGLLRCKMTEVELSLVQDGWPETDIEDAGPCCEGDQAPNMSCTWIIERPVFPDPNFGELDLDTELDSSPLGSLAGQSADVADPTNLSSVTSSLSEGLGAAGGVGGIASMFMPIIYPDLKALLEAGSRRITVELTWTEGSRTYRQNLVQWVTQPQPGMTGDTERVEDALEANQEAAATPGGGNATATSPAANRGATGRNR